MSISPYAAATSEHLAEIIRQAEARLASQLTLGVAADQRAMTMAAILGAIDAALIGLAGTLERAEFGWSLVVLIAGFMLSATLAAWTAMPIAWDIPGNEPGQWKKDIENGVSLVSGLASMAEHYDDMISANHARLSSSANIIRMSFVSTVLTLVIAGFLNLMNL